MLTDPELVDILNLYFHRIQTHVEGLLRERWAGLVRFTLSHFRQV
jgi:hypothetical protein